MCHEIYDDILQNICDGQACNYSRGLIANNPIMFQTMIGQIQSRDNETGPSR